MEFGRGNIKKSLELGIFSQRIFRNDFDAANYIMKHLEIIIRSGDPEKTPEQIIEEYSIRYVTIEDSIPYFKEVKRADPSLMFLLYTKIHGLPGKILRKYGIRRKYGI
jgi:hypothetical protein